MNSKSITDRVFLNLTEKILLFNIPQITQYILPNKQNKSSTKHRVNVNKVKKIL